MCGILAFHGTPAAADVQSLAEAARRHLAHRGPDGMGVAGSGHSAAAHTRLAIVDVSGGAQPIYAEDERTLLACNGEIYNHRTLRGRLGRSHRFKTRSDSEVVLHLYEELGADCVRELDGMFAFFVSDGERFTAARDPFGIKPLYFGRDRAQNLWFASEFKALRERCSDFTALPPGSLVDEGGAVRRWYNPAWADSVGQQPRASRQDLVQKLEQSVCKRLMSDVPMGVFLSGGLDSSVIAALACRHLGRTKSFAVGVPGAPDLEAASFMARVLGTDHYECAYSAEDVGRELERIIYHLESYDVALIRSAVPCYFLSKLAAAHVKVALTGEGADELFAGYAHFKDIHEAAAVHQECVRLLLGLHSMNLQRVDRMTMAHGLEGRVPFLDVAFVDWAMSLDPALKLRRAGVPEKWVLRHAVSKLLPLQIVHRQKLEFSEGSGADQLLQSHAEARVSDRDITAARRRFPDDPPSSKEALLYRLIFEGLFPGAAARRTVQVWRGGAGAANGPSRPNGAHDVR